MKGQNRVYNLGFGNLETNGETTEVNDKSTDNNTDASKVLNTVFACMCHFLKQEADAKVVFFGNTEHKHILYKQKVSTNLKELIEVFNVYGGKVNCDIPKVEHTYICNKNGKERTKTIRQKDLTNLTLTAQPTLEIFDNQCSRTYDFVLFLLKTT